MPQPLRKIAATEGIPLGTIEKDYTLSIALSLLSENPLSDSLTFKGGTAIKKIYFPQAMFSEDLDFNFLDITPEKIEDDVSDLLVGKKIGDVEFLDMKNINHTDVSFTCDISFIGQLQFKNKIKLDFSGRERPALRVTKQAITDIYGIRMKIPTLNISEILAEKIRALLIRGKPRDLYDVWFLMNNNIAVDLGLIDEKLKLYDREFESAEFIDLISRVESTWTRDLQPLLASVPMFELVEKEVINALEVNQKTKQVREQKT